MFCMHCGTKLPDGAKFCFSCGTPVNGVKRTTHSINSVQLRCKSCNGVMDVDEDRPILMCPFCSSKEIILEGDKVTIQRIKSKAYRDVELGKQQTYKEVELGKKELEKEKRKSFLTIVLIFFVTWILSIVGLVIVSIHTADGVGFSPYQFVLILDIVLGVKVIRTLITKNRLYFDSRCNKNLRQSKCPISFYTLLDNLLNFTKV